MRFAGLIRKRAYEDDSGLLIQMGETLRRSPAEHMTAESFPQLLVSIVTVSTMPGKKTAAVWNNRADVCLLWHGQIFGDRENTLSQDEYLPSHAIDSLFDRYEKQGTGVLRDLNGFFSGLIVDLTKGHALLFNDRFGLGRIYFHESEQGFFFASEAKALLRALPQLRELDLQGLGEWLSCGCVLQDRTLFRNISLVPGGSVWTFSPGAAPRRDSYFRPQEWLSQPRLAKEDYYQRLRCIFPGVLNRYFSSSESVGMSLTGGLDGRMVMAWSQARPGQLPCYTFSGSYRDSADVQIARRIAASCRQSHHTIPVAEEFLNEFPVLAEKCVHLSDGAMDVSGAAELYVNRLARRIAPVRLTGNYGSEILRGNVAFRPGRFNTSLFSPELCGAGEQAVRTYESERTGHPLAFIAFKQMPWHHYSRLSIEQSQVTVRSPFLDNDLVALAFQAPDEAISTLELSLRLIADGMPALARIPTDRGITCEASASRNRLRSALEEFFARAEYAYDYGMPQWLARVDNLLSTLRLERLFLGRQKFAHFRIWYRDQLASYVSAMLLDSRSLSRAYLQRSAVEALVASHLKGTRNATLEIHKLLSLELMHRTLLEGF